MRAETRPKDEIMGDPIIEELRRHRLEHARKFNFDLAAICEDLRALQREEGLKVVRLPPNRLAGKDAS
jgi:hypothetical protein